MTIEVDGLIVHYEAVGQGPPALLLHGWGQECDSKLMLPVAQRLADMRTCYALDFPGFGATGEPPPDWGVPEYAAFTARFMDALGIERADIIAHSFGGRVALVLGSDYAPRVNKLVITGGAGLIPRRGFKYSLRVGLYKLGRRLRAIGWLNALLKKLGLNLDARAQNAGSADYRAASPVMRQVFVRVVNRDLRPLLPHVQAPALLIWGELDDATPLAFGQIMRREIPDAGLVVFEGGGHFAYLHQVDRFVTIVRNFFGG